MATPQEPTETQARYPSYEALLEAQQWVRPAPNSGQLLFWTLKGPWTSAISVMPGPSSPAGPLEPYYNQDNKSWHPISHLSITEPKVSSITARVYQMDEWDAMWCEEHEEHADPDDDEGGNDDVEWTAEVSDDGTTERELIKCCGEVRPRERGLSVTVKPSRAGDDAFVTVHDFLEVVHPWLMSLKNEILTAKGILEGNDGPLGNDMELMVNANGLESLMIESKEEWMALKARNSVRTINISAS